MPKDFSRLDIAIPDFGDSEVLLKTLGTIVADEIVDMIDREEQPDGSPQKQNTEKYARRKAAVKGYTTPLKGLSKESPYLARRATFLREMTNLSAEGGALVQALVIHLNRKRERIGRYVQRKGYWFMGITREAEAKIRRRAEQYFRYKIKQMMKNG